MMQMRCKAIKALSRDINEAEPRCEDLLTFYLYVFAYELLFLIKQNHFYGNSFIKISL